MKSIQTKFIVLIMTIIIVASSVIGVVGILGFNRVAGEDSIDIINAVGGEKAQELNVIFGKIENAAEIMSFYAEQNLKSVDEFKRNSQYADIYTHNLETIGTAMADETDGVVAVYVRYSTSLHSGNGGYFKVLDPDTGTFSDFPLTDISAYGNDDIGHVGWYYIPVKSGQPAWIAPYHNENTDMDVVSYVIPFYKYKTLIGVAGMDIDFNYLVEKISQIKLYETGHAFLTDENLNIVYSRHFAPGTSLRELSAELRDADTEDIVNSGKIYEYSIEGKKMEMSVQALDNGMCIAVTVPVSEINKNARDFMIQTAIVFIAVSAVFILITIGITKKIVRPLRDLNVAASEVADGNLDVRLICKSRDEIGTLTDNFKITVDQLKKRIDYINSLAYTDKLTGMNNNTSYMQAVSQIRDMISEGGCSFSVFVIDINGLKAVNDTYGHNYGNELIIAAAEAITSTFGYENSYRIGGDEFAVIIDGADSDRCEELKKNFADRISERSGKVKLRAAVGYAVYQGTAGETYKSVFERADADMYRIKTAMKSNHENSSIEG